MMPFKFQGLDVYVEPAIPKLQLSPSFDGCTDRFRAEVNAWLLAEFGFRESTIPKGQVMLSQEHGFMVVRCDNMEILKHASI